MRSTASAWRLMQQGNGPEAAGVFKTLIATAPGVSLPAA